MPPTHQATFEIPEPSAAARARSTALSDRLRQAIEDGGGRIRFSEYMGIVLYEPELGYYSADTTKFGPEGDFMTAPEISPLFAKCLARQVSEALAGCNDPSVCEVGAGSGALAADLLLCLDKVRAAFTDYLVLETSASLRQRQQRRLSQLPQDLSSRVTWLDDLPHGGFRGVVIANEVLDALPAERFRVTDTGVQTLFVTALGDAFAPQWDRHDDVSEAVRLIEAELETSLPEGYVSDISPVRDAWLAALADRLDEALILLIDYGYPRREYYHEQRSDGTLVCHYRHRHHSDPFLWPGLQDISVHVDFTALASAADVAGLSVAGFTTQAAFLMATGLLDALRDITPDSPAYLQLTQQVKQLTLPGEMGDAVKVLALSKGLDGHWCGFSGRDFRAWL